MHEDSIADWQRLTQLYGEMGNVELEELNASIGDLTEVAQQVLRDEMKKRGLNEPSVTRGTFGHQAPLREGFNADSPTEEDDTEDGEPAHEFTWKTPLCDCEGREEAWQIREALRQAGIESWIEGQGSRVWDGMSNPRILVAAEVPPRSKAKGDSFGSLTRLRLRPVPAGQQPTRSRRQRVRIDPRGSTQPSRRRNGRTPRSQVAALTKPQEAGG